VVLPVFPAEAPAPRPAAIASATAPAAKALRLLVVDDEPVISKLVSTMLQRHGHHLTLVQQGQDAWDQIAAAPHDFDALIMDLNMPGLSGLEVARRAREIAFDRPIVVMTGHVTADDRRELDRLGITSIIHKPFSAEEFVAAFTKFVTKR
jgi:CheY-like chemotaxis protein